MNNAIHAENLYKSYNKGKTPALQGISFDVRQGEIFGIIGPDGAGKTTLFRILTTLLLPEKGQAQVEGFDVVRDYKQIRKICGYMPGRFSLYQDLTVLENLTFFATLFGTTIEENYDLIKDIYSQIEPFKHRRAGALSGGMKQKLALSCALIHKPAVLFLDEPTTGVDPVSRKEFWGMLRRLKEQGITIVVSTPYMDEASLCDRIALIKTGRFLGIDTPSGIIESYTETLWAIEGEHMYSLLTQARQHPDITSCFAFGDVLHATANPKLDINTFRSYLENKQDESVHIREIKPNIEDCYMQLSKGGKS